MREFLWVCSVHRGCPMYYSGTVGTRGVWPQSNTSMVGFWGQDSSCIKIHTNVEVIWDFAFPFNRLCVCNSQTIIHWALSHAHPKTSSQKPKKGYSRFFFPFLHIYTLGFFFKNQIPTQLCTKPLVVIWTGNG
jgi:hypothetical protein